MGDIEVGLIVKHSVKVWLKAISYTIGSNSIPQLFCFEPDVGVSHAAKHRVKDWLKCIVYTSVNNSIPNSWYELIVRRFYAKDQHVLHLPLIF